MGVFAYDVPLKDPRYGQFQRCPNNPVEEDYAMQERLRRFGNLHAYRDMTFASFNTNLHTRGYTKQAVESLRGAKKAAQAYAEVADGWLLLQGAYGCGKTHLAVAVANQRLEQFGERVLFITAPDLLDFLRRSFGNDTEGSFDEYFEMVKSIPLLVLDDLGVENPSPWAREKLFQLLNHRHVSRLSTVITANAPLSDFEPRLASRLTQSDVVKRVAISAPDYRRIADDTDTGSPKGLDALRFDNFSCDSYLQSERENLSNALQHAREWANHPIGWLCIMGGYGTGKTHLAAAIAKDLRERYQEVVFTTVPDLLDDFRVAFNPGAHVSFYERFHEVQHCPILILDDLSMASATPWAKEKLYQIIDARFQARLPTVFATARTPDQVDERLRTRLFDRRICTPFVIQARPYFERQQDERVQRKRQKPASQ